MKIYHNPRCGTSRTTLGLIREAGIEPEIVEYLKTPLSGAEIRALLDKLGISAEELIRKRESLYKENFKEKTLDEAGWIQVMVDHPILMQRPVVETETRAILSRPADTVKTLL